MNEQELNKKLAEWAGFLPSTKSCPADNHMRQPTEFKECLPVPDFTQSLDACFKWLVPKLFTWSIGKNWELQKDFTIKADMVKASVDIKPIDPDLWDTTIPGEAVAENPALALCLAIEKLIDRQEKTPDLDKLPYNTN